MSIEAIAQLASTGLAVLAIIWHQQRSIDKLRDEFNQAINKLRDDVNQAIDKLRDGLAANGQRLARIEGFLGIGMPPTKAEEAAGAEATPSPTPR